MSLDYPQRSERGSTALSRNLKIQIRPGNALRLRLHPAGYGIRFASVSTKTV